MTPKELSDRLIDFAVRAGQAADAMPETRLGRHVSGQLVRSGTSPAPNYEEGCAAESKADFAHKLSMGACQQMYRGRPARPWQAGRARGRRRAGRPRYALGHAFT
ncbi:MAG: four helix bundle protein, partial [Planctomycetota bacterium]